MWHKSPRARIKSLPFMLFLFALLSAFLFLGPGLGGPEYGLLASTPSASKDQIEKIEKELLKEKQKFLKVGEKEKNLLAQLSELERHIELRKKALRKLRKEIQQGKKELEERHKRIKKLEQSSSTVEKRIGQRLDAFYRYARRAYLKLLVSSADIEQLRRRFKYLRLIMEGDRRLIEKVSSIKQKEQEEISLVRRKIAAIEKMEKAESAQALALKQDMDKRVMLLMKIHQEKEFYRTAVKELEQGAENMKRTLLNLEGKKKQRGELPSGFSSSKGRIPLPIHGKIIRAKDAYGVPVPAHKGIFIEGPSGAEVKAVYDGRVDFSGWLKGYGQVIIINHGSRYFSVSALLAERKKFEGDMVKRGETIGLLAYSGPSSRSRLYFEVRKGASRLDPAKWLKLH